MVKVVYLNCCTNRDGCIQIKKVGLRYDIDVTGSALSKPKKTKKLLLI